MGQIRVHFGPMTQMLRSIVADLLGNEPDIAIVGHSFRQDECLQAARKEHAAIIVAQDAESDGSTCLDLILAEAPLAVLALSADGHSAARVNLVRRPITLDSASPSVLATAIRRVAAELGSAAAQITLSQDIPKRGSS